MDERCPSSSAKPPGRSPDRPAITIRFLDRVGDARLVLLGEASHGTREIYRERAQIPKRLLTGRGARDRRSASK